MSAHHHDDPALTVAGGRLLEVADRVFAWHQPDGTWWVNNAGVVIGGESTLIVDTCATEERTRRFLAAVAARDAREPAFAVNTHEHGDHTYGNSLLPSSTCLIGHHVMAAHLAVDALIEGCPPAWEPLPHWGAVTRRVPTLTLSSGLDLDLGGTVAHVRHPGHPAHTEGDLVVWLPGPRVLFTGDLVFAGLTPLCFMGSVDGARRSLSWLADFAPSVLVPGHGEIVSEGRLAEVLSEHERYYRFVESVAARALDAGLSPLEAARACDLGEFAAWADAERIVLNLHRAMADASGRPMDLVAAIFDAVSFLGRPMTTHVCCGG